MVDPSDIKLLHDDEVYGFHRTAEGREFLRQLYPSYLDREVFGDWKVASVIAEEGLDNTREIERTRAALKRWSGGQKEIWSNDAAKTLNVMRKLELQMMFIDEIREILEDQSASIHKVDVGNALAILFYGMNMSLVKQPRLSTDILASYEGLFDCDEDSWGSNRHHRKFCSYYRRPAGCNFLIVHEFELDAERPDHPVMRNRSSGYALAVEGLEREIYRFMIDHQNPASRTLQVLTEYGSNEDVPRKIVYQRARHNFSLDRLPVADEQDAKLITYSINKNKFMSKFIERFLWDIVL